MTTKPEYIPYHEAPVGEPVTVTGTTATTSHGSTVFVGQYKDRPDGLVVQCTNPKNEAGQATELTFAISLEAAKALYRLLGDALYPAIHLSIVEEEDWRLTS